MSKKTDWLATAQSSQSTDFKKANPHLFERLKQAVSDCEESRNLTDKYINPKPKKSGKRRKEMNKTEARFAALLDARIARGEIVSWAYEEITLRWPDGMRYTADFSVIGVTDYTQMNNTGPSIPMVPTILIEVKGAYAWAKDVVKFRSARDKWGDRFRFEYWQEVDGEWKETR